MRLSDDRINYLSHHIIKTLTRDGMFLATDEISAVQGLKKIMIKFLRDEETIDQKVRTKISSIKRGIPEGSQEWQVLYDQYYLEEMSKLK